MAAESTAGAALLWKFGLAGVIGLIGAAAMAAFDPPKDRKELFLQAAAAGTGSMVFGHLSIATAAHFITFVPAGDLVVPAYFLTGALSWGVFGALAKLRSIIHRKGGDFLARKTGLDKEPPQ